ncbi:MAG: hypothetical protein JO276_06490 [Sphingomonadaceae bacterium]|nr:hypothetical protein [Sphingomonadaceae bacterium]
MPYDQIVFIGYVLDTTPKENPNGSSTYLGVEPPSVDIAARCELVQAAMETARNALPPLGSPPLRTLYVFMIPEFFFRGPDPGAYDMGDVQLAIAGLQELAAGAEWADWVFEFGTIVGRWVLEDPSRNVQICNFALVQEGGVAAQGPAGARAIVKELKSGVDFIAQNASPGGLLVGEVEYQQGAQPQPGKERQQASYDGAGIYDLVGLTWATEICRDHLMGRLQNSPQMPGESEVQIQLVPSCGADIEEAGIIAETGGYVFNVDGWRDNYAHAKLVKVLAPPQQPQQLPRSANVPVNVTEVTVPVSPPRTIQIDELYPDGAGSIWIFAPVPVPPAATVPGSTDTYVWRASTDPVWTFTFYLIYDDAGQFTQVLCKIRNNEIDFYGHNYDLPIELDLTFPPRPNDPSVRTGKLKIELKGGGSYSNAIYGKIQVPGFSFQGDIMRFMNDKNAPEPVEQIW